MWKEGHHRKAIQNLQGSIALNAFQPHDTVPVDVSVTAAASTNQAPNRIKAQAQLLLAKWLDRSGQTKQGALKDVYVNGLMAFPRWEKGHYYLGRHYNKLIESEKALPMPKRSPSFLAGEMTKSVIENFIRSTVYGTKYYYQTVPKILTLWLDMGMDVMNNPNPRGGYDKDLHDKKTSYLEQINRHIKRYTSERMPAYVWYTAFPQIITRISHPHKTVWETLSAIILKVSSTYPQQALWSLLAVTRASQDDRRGRGLSVLAKLKAVCWNRTIHECTAKFSRIHLSAEAIMSTSRPLSTMVNALRMHCYLLAILQSNSGSPMSVSPRISASTISWLPVISLFPSRPR